MPVCLSACLSACLSFCLSVFLSACLPACLSVCLFAWLCLFLPVFDSLCSYHHPQSRLDSHHLFTLLSRLTLCSYIDLCNHLPAIAIFVADAPTETLEIFDAAAKDVVLEHFPSTFLLPPRVLFLLLRLGYFQAALSHACVRKHTFSDYNLIKSDIHVRVGALPVLDAIRDIRQTHLNALVKIQGVVTRRTGIFPQLKVRSPIPWCMWHTHIHTCKHTYACKHSHTCKHTYTQPPPSCLPCNASAACQVHVRQVWCIDWPHCTGHHHRGRRVKLPFVPIPRAVFH